MMARQPRVDRASERQFAKLCSDAGLFCQMVTEDETGWDCLVEFPSQGYVGPAESQPGGKRAYVQIKSRVQPTVKTDITLSNARKMVQDPAAWFVVLFHEPPKGKPEIYAKHIWHDLIDDFLKRIRQADIKGQSLHRRKMTITFDSRDLHTDDLCSWMEKIIDEVGRDYSEKKRSIFETVGYEEGYGTASFTIGATSRGEIADAFLGLGDGIEITDWKFVQRRFGIAAPFPELEFQKAKLTITPTAHEKCVVRLRNSTSGDVIAVDGTLVHNGLAAFDFELAKARLLAGFLDITFSRDTTYNLSIKADLERAHPLSYWRDYAKALIWLDEGEPIFEIWFKDKRIFVAEVSGARDGYPKWLESVARHADNLGRIAGNDCEVYLGDLLKILQKAQILLAVSFAPSMALQYPVADTLPDGFDQVLYYTAAVAGDQVFCSMVTRPVIESRLEGHNERRLIMGRPRLLDHYATADTLERQLEQLQAKFEKLVETVGDCVLGLGDVENVRPDRQLTVTVGGRLTREA